MSRFPVAVLAKPDEKSTPIGGTTAVASAFLPRDDAGEAIHLAVRLNRRSRGEARARTGRRGRVS